MAWVRDVDRHATMNLQRSSIGLPAPGSPSEAHDFARVGVVIAGDRQLAAREDAAGAQLLPVGGWRAGDRIIDVQADRVTLVGSGRHAPAGLPPEPEALRDRGEGQDGLHRRERIADALARPAAEGEVREVR